MGRRGRYSAAFMREAVALVTDGRSVQEVAVRLGVAPGTLWHWVSADRQQAAEQQTPTRGEGVDRAVHEAALERIRELEAENAFLGKASAYFAEKLQRKPSSIR